MKIAVLAGNLQQFRQYSKGNKNMVYCDKWPNFAGYRFSSLVEVGTFCLRKDAEEIRERVLPMVLTTTSKEGVKDA